MAEAFARSLTGSSWEVASAGSSPSGRVHPLAVQVMGERGLTLASHQSKGADALPKRSWDYVVTMGCGDACPAVAARHRLDWELPDPAGLSLEDARRIRDEIERRVRALVGTHRPDTARGTPTDATPGHP